MRVFDQYESNIRSYVRAFPTIFKSAKGALLFNEEGKAFIDFFAGAGTLNYGHNHPVITDAMIQYLRQDGIIHGLDMATSAKQRFIETFVESILKPRKLDYKLQFTGPTGTNCVEASLKLARLIKGRSTIVSFTKAFHGLTMGANAISGNKYFRNEAFINKSNVVFMPFEHYFGAEIDTIAMFRRYLEDNSSGLDLPAAVILETIQAEGGINVASNAWLQALERLCRDYGILLIVDDIQAGNGRSGDYFSFEASGISPDMVTLSKAIGGGLPMAILLIKPEYDQWKPAEHTGTFRGNNLAFVAGEAALSYFWKKDEFVASVREKSEFLKSELLKLAKDFPELNCQVRGRGLLYGLEIPEDNFAKSVAQQAFKKGLIIELAGDRDQVVKFLPPLMIEQDLLEEGLMIIREAIAEVIKGKLISA